MTLLKSVKAKIFVFLLLTFVVFLQGLFLLPPLDRDESRFATATKNMLETSDFVDIRLADEPRYKKPVGIYWAQSFSNFLLGEPPFDEIWVYRIPSLIGCLLSIILIFLNIRKHFSEEVAYLTSFFLTTSFLLISEIHQAKSEGLLFLCINVCNLILLNLVSNFEKNISFSGKKKEILIFWIFLGLGTLIKGPIILIFVGLPLFFFSILMKTDYLFKSINSLTGYILYLIVVLPWFVLITIKAGELFWYESVINDLLRKVSSGQESHGFFPGYYTLLIFIFLWPGCVFFIDLAKKTSADGWKIIRKDMKVFFLFCWFVPGFILYELIPTKLPHYVLPTYPALSVLLSLYVYQNYGKEKLLKIGNLFFALFFPVGVTFAFTFAIYTYSEFDVTSILMIIFLAVLIINILIQFKSENIKFFLSSVFFFQVFFYLSLVHVLNPKLGSFWIASNINKVINQENYKGYDIFLSGFNEPSLLFLTGHKLTKIAPEDMLKRSKVKKNNLFIVSEEDSKTFKNEILFNSDIFQTNSFEGFNYSKGKYVKFIIFEN